MIGTVYAIGETAIEVLVYDNLLVQVMSSAHMFTYIA